MNENAFVIKEAKFVWFFVRIALYMTYHSSFQLIRYIIWDKWNNNNNNKYIYLKLEEILALCGSDIYSYLMFQFEHTNRFASYYIFLYVAWDFFKFYFIDKYLFEQKCLYIYISLYFHVYLEK